uniref:Uncharacterized protein n=1 Tax=Toxoplasma gondii COUG TaxID=1074873 RepID=A0A2G8Y051_TOXGO|nr:hypothetical protein TGCOUG_313700 [Toxoplasma gondii COUG]
MASSQVPLFVSLHRARCLFSTTVFPSLPSRQAKMQSAAGRASSCTVCLIRQGPSVYPASSPPKFSPSSWSPSSEANLLSTASDTLSPSYSRSSAPSSLPSPRSCRRSPPASLACPASPQGLSSLLSRPSSSVFGFLPPQGFPARAEVRSLLGTCAFFSPLSHPSLDRHFSAAAASASFASPALCEALHAKVGKGTSLSVADFTHALTQLREEFSSQLAGHSPPASLSVSERRALSEAVFHLFMAVSLSLPVVTSLASPSFPSASLSESLDSLEPVIDDCYALFLSTVSAAGEKKCAASAALLPALSGPAVVSLFLFFSLSSALRRQLLLDVTPATAGSRDSPADKKRIDRETKLLVLACIGSVLSLREAELTKESLLLLRVGLEALGIQGRRHRLLTALREGRAAEEAAADFFSLLPLHPQIAEELGAGGSLAGGDQGQESETAEEDDFDDEDETGEDASADRKPRNRKNAAEKNPWLSPLEREVSSLLFRLEKPHDVFPTIIGPFSYTLRNAKKKELFICQHEKDFFTNEPDRPLAREQWRYLLAELRGWKLIFLARERAWKNLTSQEAKERLLKEALQKSA